MLEKLHSSARATRPTHHRLENLSTFPPPTITRFLLFERSTLRQKQCKSSVVHQTASLSPAILFNRRGIVLIHREQLRKVRFTCCTSCVDLTKPRNVYRRSFCPSSKSDRSPLRRGRCLPLQHPCRITPARKVGESAVVSGSVGVSRP